MLESTVSEGARNGVAEPTLAARALAGDLEAFEALITPRLDRMYRTALAIVRHDADARDAVQDASVRAWREISRLRDTERFEAWLGRILVNACRDSLRSRRRARVREIDVALVAATDGTPHGAAFPDRMAERDAVRRAFERLKPEERVLLALHHAEQRPLEEIAALVGAPVGTVKWRLHQARKSLARALERER